MRYLVCLIIFTIFTTAAPAQVADKVSLLCNWKDTTGIELSSKTKANRNAANNLLKKHGMDKLKALIRGVNAANSDKYAPRISDFVELQSKTNELITWGKKNVNKGVISV